MSGEDGEEVAKILGPILGVKESWFIRRWYGEDVTSERDCSFIDINPEVSQKKNILFTWVNKKLQHRDHEGKLRGSSFAKLLVSFPRACEPVEPQDDVL